MARRGNRMLTPNRDEASEFNAMVRATSKPGEGNIPPKNRAKLHSREIAAKRKKA
jgi:hypothetical protein